jgi:hypothetical protein
MQIRIRPLSRADLETVQRAEHAFAAPVEGMSTRWVAIIDSVPVSAPQIAGTSENLLLWLQK